MNKLKKIIKDEKGSLTVFISLLFISMILFITVMIDISKVSAAKVMAQDANKMAMNAVMADYYPDLRHAYGLYAFKNDVNQQARGCVDITAAGTNRGMVNLSVSSVNVECDSGYTLGNPVVLKGQIMDEMKYLFEYTEMRDNYVPEDMYLSSIDANIDRVTSCIEGEKEAEKQKELEEETLEESTQTDAIEETPSEEEREEQLKKEQDAETIDATSERLERIKNKYTNGSDIISSINSRDDAFILAEYIEGFFNGGYMPTDYTLNGYRFDANLSRVSTDSEREFIMYGDWDTASQSLEDDLKDLIFYINLMQIIDKPGIPQSEDTNMAEKIKQAETLSETSYENLLNGGTINVGVNGKYIYMTYDQLELYLLTKSCLEDETLILQRIGEVVESNMRVSGHGDFSLTTAYTRASISSEYVTETPFIAQLFGRNSEWNLSAVDEAVY